MTRQPLPAPPADSARPRAAGAAIGAAAAAPGEGRVRGTLGPDVSPVALPPPCAAGNPQCGICRSEPAAPCAPAGWRKDGVRVG